MLLILVLTILVILLILILLCIPYTPQLIGTAIHKFKTKEKIVSLTFDDGPKSPFTKQILDILNKHQVRATFFMVGKCAQKFPTIVQQVYKNGHEIGNHTWNHDTLIGKSRKFIRQQIDVTDDLLRQLGYTGNIHFRAPKGFKFLGLPKVLAEKNRPNILFDFVAWDWNQPGVKKIVDKVMRKVKPGSIILLHDGDSDNNDVISNRSQTVEATDIIINRLKEQGYRFATISEMLEMEKSK